MPLIKVDIKSLAREVIDIINAGGSGSVSQAELDASVDALAFQLQAEMSSMQTAMNTQISANYVAKNVGEILANLTVKKAVPEIILDSLRTDKTKISWYYNSASDMGLLFNIDGTNALEVKKDGTVSVFIGGNKVALETVGGSQTKANDALASAKVYTQSEIQAYNDNVAKQSYLSKSTGGTVAGDTTFTKTGRFDGGMRVVSKYADTTGSTAFEFYKEGVDGGLYARFGMRFAPSINRMEMRSYLSALYIGGAQGIELDLGVGNTEVKLNGSERLLSTYDFDPYGAFGDPNFPYEWARTYYVNASSGVDAANRGDTATNPLKTVQYAVDLIEPSYTGTVLIVLKGNTNEDVMVTGKSTFRFSIVGSTFDNDPNFSEPTSTIPDRLNSLTVQNLKGYGAVRGIEFMNSQTRYQHSGDTISIDLSTYFTLWMCRFAGTLTGTSDKTIDYTGGTVGLISGCSFINQNSCINASALARIRLGSPYGTCSGNITGLRAVSGGMIHRYSSSNPSIGASTAASTGQGGQII